MRNADLRAAMAAPRPHDGFASRWTDVDGLRLHDRASQHDPGALPLVCLHGLAVSHRYLMPTAHRIAPWHAVHVPDLAGFGLSADPGRALSVPEHADLLLRWLDAVGLGRVALLGNSYGSQVALEIGVRSPERVASLVLTGLTVDASARSAARQVARWLLDVPREDPRQAPMLVRDVRDAGPARVAATLRESLSDLVERKLPRLRMPTLLVRGARDPIVPQRWAEAAVRLVPGGELAVLRRAPHNANYSAADRLAPTVLAFLARHADR
jgi:pimeloyl-ACP methyl ester carboxylesterase